MPSRIRDFKNCLLIHLGKNPRESLPIEDQAEALRNGLCENFSSFYEDLIREPRCLLDEYRDEKGNLRLTIEAVQEICPYFRLEKENKCHSEGLLPRTKDPDPIESLKRHQEMYKRQTE